MTVLEYINTKGISGTAIEIQYQIFHHYGIKFPYKDIMLSLYGLIAECLENGDILFEDLIRQLLVILHKDNKTEYLDIP